MNQFSVSVLEASLSGSIWVWVCGTWKVPACLRSAALARGSIAGMRATASRLPHEAPRRLQCAQASRHASAEGPCRWRSQRHIRCGTAALCSQLSARLQPGQHAPMLSQAQATPSAAPSCYQSRACPAACVMPRLCLTRLIGIFLCFSLIMIGGKQKNNSPTKM